MKKQKLELRLGQRIFCLATWHLTVTLLMLVISTAQSPKSDDNYKTTFPSSKSGHHVTVNPDNIIAPIQSTMYGVFFEDINFAADGGIYAKLVKNRSFEFLEPMMGWEQPASDRFSMNANSGYAVLVKYNIDDPNKNYLNVKINADKGCRLENSGLRGMGLKKGLAYNFSIKAKQREGTTILHVESLGEKDNMLAHAAVPISGNKCKNYSVILDEDANELVFKNVNSTNENQGVNIDVDGEKKAENKGSLFTLTNNDKNAENSFDNPQNIYPKNKEVSSDGKRISLSV